MEDSELIEKYFRHELSQDQVVEVNERLLNDLAFKKQFDIEFIILKSLKYSHEKQRIKAIHELQSELQVSRSPSLKHKPPFTTAALAALAVWLLATFISTLTNLEPGSYKWIGFLTAMIFACGLAFQLHDEFELRSVPIALLNSVLIFVMASGIDAINQGIETREERKRAALIPFTEKTTWWPTQSLVDSLVKVKHITDSLTLDNARLKQAFRTMQDSCFNTTFDNFVPVVVPSSSTIPVGAKYEANVFLAASNSRQRLQFFANGLRVSGITDPQTKVEMGKIEFTASREKTDSKSLIAKRSFEVQIKLPDTTLIQKVEYFVVQPVIKVTTGNAPTLYMNCGNTVNVEVPVLGANYNPSFDAKGASIIKGDEPGQVTIIPTQRRVSVNVRNAGVGLGSVAFDVKPIPLPRYVIRDRTGKEVDKKVGVPGNSLTELHVAPEPDPTFKKEVPSDAVYRIRSMEVIHARGTSPINRMNATNEVLNLETWRPQFKPGDRIVIEIKTVTRTTYEGDDEKVEVRNEVHQVNIN